MRAAVWALLVGSYRTGDALKLGRVRPSSANVLGGGACSSEAKSTTQLVASRRHYYLHSEPFRRTVRRWAWWPPHREVTALSSGSDSGSGSWVLLWSARSENAGLAPGSFELEEEGIDEDDELHGLDGDDHNTNLDQEEVEYDPFTLGASLNPPPPEEAWDLAAAELAAGVGPIEDDTGVDLELLEVPVHGDGEEHVDFERLDISDFLEPDVPVSGSGLGAARAGGFPGDAGGRSGGGEDLDLDLEPPDVADCLESEVGAGFGAEGGVGAGLDDRVAVGTAHGVVKKERRRKQQHGGSGFSDSEADVGYDDGDPEDGEPESKEKAPTTRGKGGGGGPGGRRGGMKGDKAGSGSVKGGFEGLTADEVERRLISAGILHEDGTEIDLEDGDGGDGGFGDEAGVFNEIEVSDGEEACRILEERLGFDEEGIAYLRSKYPPLRGELWYRREPALSGAQTGKKFLDVYFLEETLPELLDLLLGKEGGHGIGLAPKQVRAMLTATPSLLGVEASDARDVVNFLRSELALRGEGQLASALAGCPPMLMYHTWDNLRKKVSYYRESLAWTNDDVASMLEVYPKFLSIKMENDVVEVIDYLRTDIGLQPFMVAGMIKEFPELLEVRPKRLKAVVKYLWKVLEIPRSGIAVLLSQHPRACGLEAEANLAPLRQFFERELFVEDTSRIGHLVYKFPRLLFQDVESQLVPRAEEFRKAMGLEGFEPLPPRVRPRAKRNTYRAEHAGGGGSGVNRNDGGGGRGKERSGRGRGARSGSGRPRNANSGFGRSGRGGGRGRGGRANSGRGGSEYRGRGRGGYVE